LPLWLAKRETANRVRGRIETVIAKNVDVDDTDFRNPAKLTRQLREKVPPASEARRAASPILAICRDAKFMAALMSAPGTAAKMLQFLVLTTCRTNEVKAAGSRPTVRLEDPGRADENRSGSSFTAVELYTGRAS
jgi:hypothetical protein